MDIESIQRRHILNTERADVLADESSDLDGVVHFHHCRQHITVTAPMYDETSRVS